MNNALRLILLLVLIFSIFSCKKQKEVRTKLNERERVIYDSLYIAAIDPIRKEIDSLCSSQREELFQSAVDSIYEIRLDEIENLLENEQ